MRSAPSRIECRGAIIVAWSILALVLVGCGSVSKTLRTERPPMATAESHGDVDAAPAAAPGAVVVAASDSARWTGATAQAPAQPAAPPKETPLEPEEGAEDAEAYDPWEPFNEAMFELNLKLDKYVLKPVARVYRMIIPNEAQVLIANGFDNIGWVPRFVNSLIQGKWGGAGRELSRFLINSTAGIGGLFDPAKDYWGITSSREDFGQTLGTWGNGPGPYLVLPLLPPMTVRDGIGRGVDSFLNPLSYVLPFFWERFGMTVGEMINERALNYEIFEGVEETTLDLYSSVRHFYLQRREKQIKE